MSRWHLAIVNGWVFRIFSLPESSFVPNTSAIMTMKCAITGKKPSGGNSYARRGKAKYLGGVGRKVTGKTKRRFVPNLQRVKIEIDGTVQTVRVCVKAIRGGLIKRPV